MFLSFRIEYGRISTQEDVLKMFDCISSRLYIALLREISRFFRAQVLFWDSTAEKWGKTSDMANLRGLANDAVRHHIFIAGVTEDLCSTNCEMIARVKTDLWILQMTENI
jgi:hypothetical protein